MTFKNSTKFYDFVCSTSNLGEIQIYANKCVYIIYQLCCGQVGSEKINKGLTRTIAMIPVLAPVLIEFSFTLMLLVANTK